MEDYNIPRSDCFPADGNMPMRNELDQLLVEYKPADLKGAIIWIPDCPPESSPANKPRFVREASHSSYFENVSMNIYRRKKVAAY